MTVLFALDFARVSSKHPFLPQRWAEALGRHRQGTRNPVADRIGLGRNAAALDLHDQVVLPRGLSQFERLQNPHPRGVARKVVFERAVVDRDRARPGSESYAGNGALAPPRGPDEI